MPCPAGEWRPRQFVHIDIQFFSFWILKATHSLKLSNLIILHSIHLALFQNPPSPTGREQNLTATALLLGGYGTEFPWAKAALKSKKFEIDEPQPGKQRPVVRLREPKAALIFRIVPHVGLIAHEYHRATGPPHLPRYPPGGRKRFSGYLAPEAGFGPISSAEDQAPNWASIYSHLHLLQCVASLSGAGAHAYTQ